ncbi:MAG: hypothetical protein ACI8RZ_004131 [Myxococcota bacterium]|jgi:hypothetical protein
MAISLFLPLFIGCEFGLDPDALQGDSGDVIVDSGETLPDLRIERLDPDWGPTAGGTAVTITGAGFDETATVAFGGSDLTVSYINAYTLAVTTPSAVVETAVDVTVTSALGEVVLDDGYAFSNTGDPDPDTGDTDTNDPDVTPTGLVGGLVEFWYQAYFCAECFGLTSQLQISATATFHPGVSGSWLDWIPARGSCTDNYVLPNPTATSTDMGEWAYFTSGATSIPLHRTTRKGLTTYVAEGLAQDDYVKNAAYDLDVIDAGLSLPGVVQTTTNFTDFTPIDIAQTTSQQAFSAPISANNATLGWAPSGTSADMLLTLEIYHPDTFAFLGIILCRDTDTGSITVPPSLLLTGAYYAESPIAISFYRIILQETISPLDGSTIQGATFYGGIGTGKLVP